MPPPRTSWEATGARASGSGISSASTERSCRPPSSRPGAASRRSFRSRRQRRRVNRAARSEVRFEDGRTDSPEAAVAAIRNARSVLLTPAGGFVQTHPFDLRGARPRGCAHRHLRTGGLDREPRARPAWGTGLDCDRSCTRASSAWRSRRCRAARSLGHARIRCLRAGGNRRGVRDAPTSECVGPWHPRPRAPACGTDRASRRVRKF